jgi:hypothetical protein
MAVGSSARLGSRTIRVGPYAAELENGTLAGSTLTMDRAFANIVNLFGGSLVDAALMCATNPARALGLAGHGVIAEGAAADRDRPRSPPARRPHLHRRRAIVRGGRPVGPARRSILAAC